MSERERITVYRDEWELLLRNAREYASAKEELAFTLQELEEVLNDWEVFARRRFSVASSVDRLRGALGKKNDPDKTPVDSPFASRKMTAPGGVRVEPRMTHELGDYRCSHCGRTEKALAKSGHDSACPLRPLA